MVEIQKTVNSAIAKEDVSKKVNDGKLERALSKTEKEE